MVWSKVHSLPGPVTSNDVLQALWDYLPTTGWQVFDDIAGHEGSRQRFRATYDFTNPSTGNTDTLHYWFNYYDSTGWYCYADANTDGTYTTYDSLYRASNELNGDLTVWTSDTATKSLLIVADKTVLFFWFGFDAATIPKSDNPVQSGYPMPICATGSQCYWYGPFINAAGSSSIGYQESTASAVYSSIDSYVFNPWEPFLQQGFSLSVTDSNNFKHYEWTFINNPDILYENKIVRTSSNLIMRPTAMLTKFDGVNYYMTLHDGSMTHGHNVWLPCGTSEPNFRHEA